MDWVALGSIAEIAGAFAVVATLLYLARQVRQLNRHDLLTAFQHTYDSMNNWCAAIYDNADLASIVLRGRANYEALDDAERFRFDHIHIHLFNLIESHHYQVQQTSMDEQYRAWAIRNLELIVQGYLAYPGTRILWARSAEYIAPDPRELIERHIGTDTISPAPGDGGAVRTSESMLLSKA